MNAKEFGEYLKGLRRDKKLTIRQLDLYSGVSNSYISQMERGARGIPSPDILKKLSKPLGVTYEELMSKAGYFDTDNSSFDDLLYKVFRFFIRLVKDDENSKIAIQQILNEQGETNVNVLSDDYDFEDLFNYSTYPEKISLLHIFVDEFTKATEETRDEETINNNISEKYNNLSGKKREMVDNMIDMLYTDQ